MIISQLLFDDWFLIRNELIESSQTMTGNIDLETLDVTP